MHLPIQHQRFPLASGSATQSARLSVTVFMLRWSDPNERSMIFSDALQYRLGLGVAVGVLQQLREVVEADRHLGMIGAEALLVDGQRALIVASA